MKLHETATKRRKPVWVGDRYLNAADIEREHERVRGAARHRFAPPQIEDTRLRRVVSSRRRASFTGSSILWDGILVGDLLSRVCLGTGLSV